MNIYTCEMQTYKNEWYVHVFVDVSPLYNDTHYKSKILYNIILIKHRMDFKNVHKVANSF